MASKYWVKLYVEILDDPKMGLLPDRLWRRFAECLLLAKDHDKNGNLPPLDQCAWRLKAEAEELKHEFDELVTRNLLAVTKDGDYGVTKFGKRQAKNSGAERTREWRKRKRSGDTMVTEEGQGFTEEEVKEDLEVEEEGEGDDDKESSSVPKILDMNVAVLRITGQNPTTEQVETLWEAGVTEGRVMEWYKDKEHGWPSIRPTNAERPDPWISQVLEHLPKYRTHSEQIAASIEKYQ